MENVKYRKISDYQVKPDVITGGAIQRHWEVSDLEKKFNKKRSPAFPFKAKIDYTDQEFIARTYKIKGFEYGNWVTQEERYNFLVCGHISLSDLAKIMQFPYNNLGFAYKIGIAFGARGIPSAAAHFEPDTFMINLTRINGWQSLAHEYGHAIDYYFGGYIDRSSKTFSLSGGSSTVLKIDLSQFKKDSLRYLMNDLINSINTVVINGKTLKSESYNKLYAAYAGKDYWFRRTEIFARFFERYVMYRLSKLGIKNTFLAKNKYDESVYITKSDFNRVVPKMEKLLKAMQKS